MEKKSYLIVQCDGTCLDISVYKMELTEEELENQLNSIKPWDSDKEVKITKENGGYLASVVCDYETMITDSYIRAIPLSKLESYNKLPECL